jgi:hypothetical protein
MSAYDAAALGVTVDAIRKRISRGTIPHERDEHGRVWVLLDATSHVRDTDQDAYQPQPQSDALISEMRSRIDDLREQLQAERQAHAEARRLLAAALERIPPQLEAPSEARESPESGADEQGRGRVSDAGGPQGGAERPEERSWWRRMFGG